MILAQGCSSSVFSSLLPFYLEHTHVRTHTRTHTHAHARTRAHAHARVRSRTHTLSTLAWLSQVKRQGFCNADMSKMVKHSAWATTIVAATYLNLAPKSVLRFGRINDHEGQMKLTCRVNSTARVQPNWFPEHMIISSIWTNWTDLISWWKHKRTLKKNITVGT